MNNKLPLISIITPCLNRADFVSEAVESVLHQDYPNFEHIIVDGGSTDGTLDILKRYPHVKVISEPDQGLYDAINKGIHYCNGEIIGFLNTDDLYEENIFSSVTQVFNSEPGILAVLGGAKVFKKNISGEKSIIAIYLPYHPAEMLKNCTLGTPIFNAWFFRRDLLDKIGFLDTSYRFSSDRDYMIRLALQGGNFMCIEKNLYLYQSHSGSLTNKATNTAESRFVMEDRTIAEKYIGCNDITPSQRSLFRSWHSKITINQTQFALTQLNPGNALRYAVHGWRYNFCWPLIFTQASIVALNNRLFTKENTRKNR